VDDMKQTLNNKIYKILLVDDEKDILDALALSLKCTPEIQSEITTANTAEEALDKMLNEDFDLVVSDYKMPGMNGVDLLSMVNDIHPEVGRILITGLSDVEIAKKAINKAKVDNYIEKPWYNEDLRSTILSTLIRKGDHDKYNTKSVDSVRDALKAIWDAKNTINVNDPSYNKKQMLILEFRSSADFNKFSFEIRKMKNISIDDVEIFENKYIVKLGIYLDSFEKIV
jgi:YesN/AraC family two-component response regulator